MMRNTLALLVLLVAALLGVPAVAGGGRPLEGVVNLNTATEEQLQLLPGIGPAKARSILEYRRTRPFRTVEELVRVKGIGRKMVRRIREHVTVSGATTAEAAEARTAAPAPPPAPATPPAGAPGAARP
jgi:competence protein ComEA